MIRVLIQSRKGKSQRRREKKKKDQRRRETIRERVLVERRGSCAQKGKKAAKHCLSQWFVESRLTEAALHRPTCNCNYIHKIHYSTTTTPLHYNYSCDTQQAVVGEVTGQVATATIAATPRNTAPTTCQSISGIAPSSGIHSNQALL